MPPLVLSLDFVLIFLQFGAAWPRCQCAARSRSLTPPPPTRAGAATALAGLRGGFSDLQLGGYCGFNTMCVCITAPHTHCF